MKVFKNLGNDRIVGVQIADIMYLMSDTHLLLPQIVEKTFVSSTTHVDKYNQNFFLFFTNEEVVRFFENLDFILDYDEYKNLSIKELERKAKEISEYLEYIDKFKNNSEFKQDVLNLNHKLASLSYLFAVKKGEETIPFPPELMDK